MKYVYDQCLDKVDIRHFVYESTLNYIATWTLVHCDV